MEFKKSELLKRLSQECGEYCSIPESEQQVKRDKKNFINGLMTACRVVGISFEELSAVTDSMPKEPKFRNLDEKLSVPTFIRNEVELKI
ncbi:MULTISPECIES: hypothetical protein [Vibrio]|uniref:hypothetical protein n=1 Tax=Vibrio TaxID=662 RepID=UPI0005FB2975|nr:MULTISPECIES: hypothetical protein [Vibrio]EID0723913.1 hypothetical protein [Vibrio parahaemolyticus]EJG1587840.1 hypothetical protein [Vibrio parahaemolyticus]MCG6451262.1 hypothetical protein [Vibrio parahaemolyticus]HCH3521616.1 hypothetical protein [Vibrio parahaemolyticus]HCH6535979.1 hypothetical protein [Vibrio parahaemolyticus]